MTKTPLLVRPIFLALDLDNREKVLELAERTRDFVGGFKIGPRLVLKYGGGIVQSLSKVAPVFLDAKYYDIPSVMEASVQASFDQGASFVSVHAMAGEKALRRLAKLEKNLNEIRFFRIIAVTILTSFSQETLPTNFSSESIEEQVKALVQMIFNSGLKTVVCSPLELKNLVKLHPSLSFVTPGVRFATEEKGDQERVLEPQEAMDLGASALVVGRPIYLASDPVVAAKKYMDKILEREI